MIRAYFQRPPIRIAAMLAAFGSLLIMASSSGSALLFAGFALFPSVIAAFLERRGQRIATAAIGTITFATILPILFGGLSNSRNLLASASAWSFVGAAVLAGVALYLLLPVGAVWLDDFRAEGRLRKLRQEQDTLERDWGPEVRAKVER
jgi:hypothetical protein